MGSQGRLVSSVATSAKFAENKQASTIRVVSDEVTKNTHVETLGMLAENNDREGKFEKKRKIQDVLKSVAYLYSEDRKLNLKIEEELYSLHDILGLTSTMPASICYESDGNSRHLRNETDPVSKPLDDLAGQHFRPTKKRKMAQKHCLGSEPCGRDAKENLTDNVAIECTQGGHFHTEKVEAVRIDQSTAFFEMLSGDYMKLLELDNPADEEKFRLAMEMPLSPLHDIIFTELKVSEDDDSSHLIQGGLYKSLTIEEKSLVPSHTFDVIDMEIDSNRSKIKISDTSQGLLSHNVKGPAQLHGEPVNNDEQLIPIGQNAYYQVPESDAEMGIAKQMPISSSTEVQKVVCTGIAGLTLTSIPTYFVVFSNSKDAGCISRVFCARENCISRSCIFSQTDWVVKEVLLTLALEQDLQPEEKACVFFSLLLNNFSVAASANSRCVSTGDLLFWSDSFAEQLNRVLSDVETQSLFLELCQRDILFSLIEDFLIGRRVLVRNDVPCEPLHPCNSGSKVLSLDGRIVFVSSKTATIDQLVAGGIILSSICTAIDHIGFICEASYNILRLCKTDSSWVLMALHIFASVCGKKYFSVGKYSLIMAAITSIVSFLERGGGPVGTLVQTRNGSRIIPGTLGKPMIQQPGSHDTFSSCVPSASDVCPQFSPCAQCPFAEGTDCVEEVILLLLEKLQDYDISGIGNQLLKEPIPSLVYTIPAPMVRSEENPGDGNDLDGMNTDGGESCCLLKEGIQMSLQPNFVTHWSFCHFSDIVSLLELIACYKSWDWTYAKLIHPLLKMLDSHVSEECSAAILILIGQLGRLGIDSGGYRQKGIKELICSLSTFLDLNTSERRNHCLQFATVSALISLLSLDFLELIDNSPKLTVDTSQPAHEIVRKWFSQLTNEQKSLAFSIFQSADVKD
ncbi:uncharacterized protein LOC143892572 [Tasmannia lanceolata]|uniref:uncharacterized protein LOC143892572 n=1 Tax=Tasmannia lanceolata TaxID=3420 RepID=UPI0040642C83